MPSLQHEALLVLFRNRPTLAPELLHRALGVALPAYTEARIEDAALTEVTPTEYDADLVVLLLEGKPVFGIVVEAQLGRDEDKHFTWPFYAMALRAKKRCPTCVLVVTPHPEVAEWASRPVQTGQPGVAFAPLVLGPSGVPWVRQAAEARETPELAVLSAMAHGAEEGALEVAVAALGGASGLDAKRAALYYDLVVMALNDGARRALEAYMQSGGYEYRTEFGRKYFGQGKAEGEAEGEAKGEAKALLKILERRGLPVTEGQRARVLACTDVSVLDGWIDRALDKGSADEVLE